MALYIIIQGETMEMKSISRGIKVKDPGFDGNLFRVMHLCSTNSPASFKAIIYSIDCAKDLDIMMELYDIVY